jgi:hypothetical protein
MDYCVVLGPKYRPTYLLFPSHAHLSGTISKVLGIVRGELQVVILNTPIIE